MKETLSLSVVIPCFNEEEVIGNICVLVRRILSEHEISHEIVIVDDGSTDATLEILLRLKEELGIRVIKLAKNSGHMNALLAGLEAARGLYIATIDADLQDPPIYLPQMLKTIKASINDLEPIDVVQAYRLDRASDTIFKRSSAALYYKFVKWITGVNIHPHAADYRLLSRFAVRKILSLPTRHVVLRILIPQLGFKTHYIPITRESRQGGETKYSLKNMFLLTVDSVVSSSFKPMRLLAVAGFFLALIFTLMAVTFFVLSLTTDTVPGWSSLVLLLTAVSAFNFACLGALGEYVGRSYDLLQGKPAYIYREL